MKQFDSPQGTRFTGRSELSINGGESVAWLGILSLTFFIQGCFIITNATKSDVPSVLLKMHNSQKHFFQTNNRYSNNLKELEHDFVVKNPDYQYGFNPKCFPSTSASEDQRSHPNFGFTKKNFFTSWLQKQPCRPDGFTFYGVRQLGVVEFEIFEINENKEIKEHKLP